MAAADTASATSGALAVASHADLGRRYSASDYLSAVQDVQLQARRIAVFHQAYDLFMTPTTASAPVALGHFEASVDDPVRPLHVDAAFAPFTWMANATGQPAMSVPLHWTDDGLPIGTHVTAAGGREDLLFRLAGQLEQARPWSEHRPPPLSQPT